MATTRWLSTVEDEAWRDLRRVYLLAFAEISRDLQRDSGLSDADYEVLTSLSESPGDRLRFGDLATATRWSTSRLSHHLDRMQRRDLVERTENADDGRGSDVVLTAHGRTTIEDAAPRHLRSVRHHVFDHLTPEQVEQLAEITAAIVRPHDGDLR